MRRQNPEPKDASIRGLRRLCWRVWVTVRGKHHIRAVADIIDVPTAGFYTLRDGDRSRPVAINASVVDRIESRPLASRIDKPETKAVTRTVTREQPWSYLLMIVIAILAIEWFTFHRRWTV